MYFFCGMNKRSSSLIYFSEFIQIKAFFGIWFQFFQLYRGVIDTIVKYLKAKKIKIIKTKSYI